MIDSRRQRALAEVLDAVDALTGELVATAAGYVRIPSVSGTDAEHEAQAHVASEMGALGLDVDHWRIDVPELERHPDFPGAEVERTEAWGLVGRRPGADPGGAPSLLLNGHIDVVPTGDPERWTDPPFGGQVRDGRLFGRGACDMKAGMAAIMVAVRALVRSGVRLRGDLLVASVQGEEDGGLGSFATLQRGWRADACVIAEPTELDIIPANAGALTFRLRVRGAATHAARRAEGVSSIEKFWPVFRALQELETRRHQDGAPMPEGWISRYPLSHPISIGTVSAGDWASSVPDLLVAEGRMGVALGEPVAEARAALEQAVAHVCALDPWLQRHPVEVEWWGGQFASGQLPVGSDLVERVAAAHRGAGGRARPADHGPADDRPGPGDRGASGAPGGTRGRDPAVYPAPYGSDLRLWTGLGGVPTVQYGPGDVQLAHGPLESVPIDDMRRAARTLATLAVDHCGIV